MRDRQRRIEERQAEEEGGETEEIQSKGGK